MGAAAASKIELKNIEFHEQIGEGGFSTVQRVTFKKPFKGYTEAAAKTIFEGSVKEVDIMSKLHHPNIVTFLGFFKIKFVNVILLEYAQLGSLHDYLADKSKPISDNLMYKWLKDAALAIRYLHSRSVLHRDIKPKNCLLFKDNVLKLCDFCLSREIDNDKSQTTSSQKGTFSYMAPEIHKGNDSGRAIFSKPADIYAYGMLILEMRTRKPPFDGMEWLAVVMGVGNGTLQPAIPDDCPQDLADIMKQCWNVDPKQRPTIGKILATITISVLQTSGEVTISAESGFSSYDAAHEQQEITPRNSDISSHKALTQQATTSTESGISSNVDSARQQVSKSHETDERYTQRQQSNVAATATKWSNIEYSNLIIREMIGKGGFGEVYRVEFKTPHRGYKEAAVKSLAALKLEEIELLSRFSHPNIVTILGFCQFTLLYLIVLELAPHGSLYDFLKNDSEQISNNLQRKWIKESALAIQYLHKNNVLHMDIKSKNCLLFHKHVLKLCDFGLAVKLDGPAFTHTAMRGTWQFCAPEILKPKGKHLRTYSVFTDIFSYGMLVFEICTRKPPFADMKRFELVTKIVESEGVIQPTILATCPHDLSDLMKRCWNATPEDRPTIDIIIGDLVYSELVTAATRGVNSLQLSTQSICKEKSDVFDQEGGKLEVYNTGAAIKILKGAISNGESVEITASVHWGKDVHPPIQDNDFVIGPAIQCKPDGLQFKKPVEVILPHSAENITAKDITIWTKTPTEDKWHILYRGTEQGNQDSSSSKKAGTVILDGKRIKIRVHHFSWFTGVVSTVRNFLGYPYPTLRMEMLSFMNPSILGKPGLFITIYAVREDQHQNVIDEEHRSQGYQCSTTRPFKLTMNQETLDMNFTVKCLLPENAWTPEVVEDTIKYEQLQEADLSSKCTVLFTKIDEKADTIMGKIYATLNGKGLINGEAFENTKCVTSGNKNKSDHANVETKKTSQDDENSTGGCGPIDQTLLVEVTDRDLRQLTKILRPNDLQFLYAELKLSQQDVETVEASVKTSNARLKAIEVLRHWHKINGRAATRKLIIVGLKECDNFEAVDTLQDEWK